MTLRFDDELHKQVKVKMAMEGRSIQEYIISLIKADLEKDQKK